MRLLDEFSKNFFTIPINLRYVNPGGLSYHWLSSARQSAVSRLLYPPSDNEVREFLTDGTNIKKSRRRLVSHTNFLFAIFKKTTQTVKDLGGVKLTRVRKFLDFLSRDQHTVWDLLGPTGLNSMWTSLIRPEKYATYSYSFVFIFQFILLTQSCESRDHEPWTSAHRPYPLFWCQEHPSLSPIKQLGASSSRPAKKSHGWFNEKPLCDGANVRE